VVSGGSSDYSERVARRFNGELPLRLRSRKQENLGQSAGRNHWASEARGGLEQVKLS
jgi:hypothetical protein